RLPNPDRAVIDAAKLRDYLLSTAHPVGRFKAHFFASLGYSAENWEQLDTDIRDLIAAAEAHPRVKTEYGQKYEVRGSLTGPGGRRAEIVTVWIILAGEEVPRFVTAYTGS
ncbi:MAG: hypothetical protein V3U35_06420, partial [Candidatus Neomarinimicrobiota bacterium]